MSWFITFLEGILSFLSPCTLPLLPVYISFFAGTENSRSKALVNSLLFVLGFTVVFVLLGALSGTVGSFLNKYGVILNIILGILMIFFGLCVMEVFRLPSFRLALKTPRATAASAFVFGLVFSLAMTPCTGAYLGSALMLAASKGSTATGIGLLIIYSMGLGVPFIISALITDKLSSLISAISKHRLILNRICGVFLILVGIITATGLLSGAMSFLS